MGRPRTGSLEEREDSFYVRLTVDADVAGTVKRQWFCLNTKDPETAARLWAESERLTGVRWLS